MKRIECEIDRWEGRRNTKAHLKEMKEHQKRHNTLNHDRNTTSGKNAHKNNTSENLRSSCNKWEYFHEEQQQNTVLPTLGNLLRTLDDGSWRRRLRRLKDRKRGNKKIGEINHLTNVAPEANRSKSARAA